MSKHVDDANLELLAAVEKAVLASIDSAESAKLCASCFLLALSSFAIAQIMRRDEVITAEGVDEGRVAALFAAVETAAVVMAVTLEPQKSVKH